MFCKLFSGHDNKCSKVKNPLSNETKGFCFYRLRGDSIYIALCFNQLKAVEDAHKIRKVLIVVMPRGCIIAQIK